MKYQVIILGSLLSGGLADSLAEIGSVGAGGAVIGSVLMFTIGVLLKWDNRKLLEHGGYGALAGAPIMVTVVAYGNFLTRAIG